MSEPESTNAYPRMTIVATIFDHERDETYSARLHFAEVDGWLRLFVDPPGSQSVSECITSRISRISHGSVSDLYPPAVEMAVEDIRASVQKERRATVRPRPRTWQSRPGRRAAACRECGTTGWLIHSTERRPRRLTTRSASDGYSTQRYEWLPCPTCGDD